MNPYRKIHYHPDHLGSSSWITDPDGRPVQHIQYLPFGETWADQRSASWNAPYTFSGKEKDWETSYHYYGARYYDSDLSIWLSVDPLVSYYPHQTPYVYCSNNPIMRIDPNGMSDGWIDDGTGNVFWDANTNSQKDFDANYTGRSGYSYVSDPDNPNAYTLPNGDGKLVLNEWTTFENTEDGVGGVNIELEFQPSNNNSDCGWFQSYSSNIPDIANYDEFNSKMPGGSMEERIDCRVADKTNVANSHYFGGGKSRHLSDWPQRKLNEGAIGSVKWNAQSSMIINGNRSFTVSWGFTIDSPTAGSGIAPRITNSPTRFHLDAINHLP